MKGHLRALGIAAVISLATVGCTRTVYITEDPPAPQAEAKPPSPGSKHVWVDGHWKWNGNRYIWVSGHWERTKGNKAWVAGHWDRGPHGWHWIPGHWK